MGRRSVWIGLEPSVPRPLLQLTLRATLLCAALAAAPALAGKAHEHGVARAEVGVEVGRITVSLELPLHDLVGFERAPRTDAERAAVAAALGKLQEATRIVRADAAAGCGAGRVDLQAPVWGVGGAAATPAAAAPSASAVKPGAPAKAGNEHADLLASYEFRCSNTNRAAMLELGLFDAFARFNRIEVQAVTPKGQMKLVLRRPNARVALAR
jgi:hypothetical protein